MSTILMDIYSFYIFAVNIAASLWPFVDHKTSLAVFMCEISKCRSEKTGSDYKIIVHGQSLDNYIYNVALMRDINPMANFWIQPSGCMVSAVSNYVALSAYRSCELIGIVSAEKESVCHCAYVS